MLELHGKKGYLTCASSCGHLWEASSTLGTDLKIPSWDEEGSPEDEAKEPTSATSAASDVDRWRAQGDLPVCPKCQGPARPWVRLLGEDPIFDKLAQADSCALHRENQTRVLRNWTKEMKDKPHSEKTKVLCLELGCGLGAPAVRTELEKVMEMFPSSRYLRINREEDSTFPRPEWRDRTVSVKDGVDQAFAAMHAQILPKALDMCRFVVKDRGSACRDVLAPSSVTPLRLLYILERAGIGMNFELDESGHPAESSVQVFMPTTSTPEYCEISDFLPAKSFCRPTAPMMKRTTPIKEALASFQFLHVRFKTEGYSRYVQDQLTWCRGILDDLLKALNKPELQAALKSRMDRKGIADVVKIVQQQVLPAHGLGTEEIDLTSLQWKMWFFGFLDPENERLAAEALSLSKMRISGLLPWKAQAKAKVKVDEAAPPVAAAKSKAVTAKASAARPAKPAPAAAQPANTKPASPAPDAVVVEIPDEPLAPKVKRRAGGRPMIEAHSLLEVAREKAAAKAAADTAAQREVEEKKVAAKAAAKAKSKAAAEAKKAAAAAKAKAKAEARAKARAAKAAKAEARAAAKSAAKAAAAAEAPVEATALTAATAATAATMATMGPPPVPVKAKARAAKRKADTERLEAENAEASDGAPA